MLEKENPNTPQFVYHLVVQWENRPSHLEGPKLLCTYTSYKLANLYALCWLLNEQTMAVARVHTYSNDLDNERLYEGRVEAVLY